MLRSHTIQGLLSDQFYLEKKPPRFSNNKPCIRHERIIIVMMKDANKQEKKKAKKRSYRNNLEVRDAVRYCMGQRLTVKESQKHLSDIGYKISDKTLGRIKKDIQHSDEDSIETLAQSEIPNYVRDSISMINTIKEKFLQRANDATDFWQQLRGYEFVVKLQKELALYHGAAPYLQPQTERATNE